MYYLITREESITKCQELTVSDKPPVDIIGWPVISYETVLSHKQAVSKLLKGLKEIKRFNMSLCPGHIPRTKRQPK